jgi:hypothetical protein
MHLTRTDEGLWTAEFDAEEEAEGDPIYRAAFLRYLNAIDPAFAQARDRSEFWLIGSLLGVRSLHDAGWDPYESTIIAIEALRKGYVHLDGTAQAHLRLMIYGHIVEASEPYELLANLLDIARGGTFERERFPARNGRPIFPNRKIQLLRTMARQTGLQAVVAPLEEIWDRNLRNAVFHADYSLHAGEVRTLSPPRVFGRTEVHQLVNFALAYHDAVLFLRRFHIQSYDAPTIVLADPRMTGGPAEEADVIIRDGDGASGLQSRWVGAEAEIGRFNGVWGGSFPMRWLS